MAKLAPAMLSMMLTLALVTGICPAAAFAEAADEAQWVMLEEVAETDEAADASEEPAADVAEEQPAENGGQREEPSGNAMAEPGSEESSGEAKPAGDATETPAETFDCAEAAMPAEGATAVEATAPEGEAAEQATDDVAAQAATYAHTAIAEQNGVTFTVGWDDAPAGTATTFHVTQTGGSFSAKARMDVPTYWDTDGSQESVCDPTRSQWGSYYELGDDGYEFRFELTASGSYYINFYFMDTESGVSYMRTTVIAEVNDEARPSVTQIVNNAVAQCYAETTGSEYDVALWLHDWAMDQLEYDHVLNWCSAESGLTRGRGTCESYQRIYAKLLDAAGIANGRVEGNGHTWNAVRIDGKWCQMDLTWDDTYDNWYGDLDQRHLYFGLTDELMAIAHSDHAANYQKDGYVYRSTDLSNDYFVRNGKADEWASAYAERIQQHLDAKETSFSIDADNGTFPPSICGIQNAFVAYAMNRREWNTGDDVVTLTSTSNVTTVSNYEWSAKFAFAAGYATVHPSFSAAAGPHRLVSPDGNWALKSSGNVAYSASSGSGSGFELVYNDADGAWTISDEATGLLLTARGKFVNARVTLEEADSSSDQLWSISENEDGTARISPRESEDLSLDISGGWGEGSWAMLYSSHGGENQRFLVSQPVENRIASIVSADNAYSLMTEGTYVYSRTVGSSYSLEYNSSKGAYRIADKATGLALSAEIVAINQPVVMMAVADTDNQLWTIVNNEDGTIRISPMCDQSLSLDISGGWGNGFRLMLYSKHGGMNQKFKFGSPLQSDSCRIRSVDGEWALLSHDGYAYGGSAAVGCEFSFERVDSSGYFEIIDSQSGLLLTAEMPEVNQRVALHPSDGSSRQLWIIARNGDGTYRIAPAADESLSLDVSGGWGDGSWVILYNRHGGSNQKFALR